MSNEEITYEPNDPKGRPFLEEGVWLFFMVGGEKFYAKTKIDEAAKARLHQDFEAHHVIMASMTGQGMLIAPVLGIIDPFTFNGALVAGTSFLHPKSAARLDEMVKKAFNPPSIVAAKASDIPATGKKLHLA